MDPNATLDSIRELIAAGDKAPLDEYDAGTLVDLVGALDEWLTQNGFLPTAWTRV